MAKSLYYRIGQACKEVDIQPYVLRYWETEFPVLSPEKSKSGQRVYSEEDLEVIRRIKELLYDEGFTIAGAKKRLEAELESDGGIKTNKPKKKAASKKDEPPRESASGEVDSAAAEQVETLRQGLREALSQSQAILDMLGTEPAGKGKKKKK